MILILHGHKNTSETQLVAIRKTKFVVFFFQLSSAELFIWSKKNNVFYIPHWYKGKLGIYFFILYKREQLWQIMEKAKERVKHSVSGYGNRLSDRAGLAELRTGEIKKKLELLETWYSLQH